MHCHPPNRSSSKNWRMRLGPDILQVGIAMTSLVQSMRNASFWKPLTRFKCIQAFRPSGRNTTSVLEDITTALANRKADGMP